MLRVAAEGGEGGFLASVPTSGLKGELTLFLSCNNYFLSIGLIEYQNKEAGMLMRRGSRYWLWADCELYCRTHSEVLSDGTAIDVQTRASRKGITQLFIGVYDKRGLPLYEESHDQLPNDTMTTALAWGVSHARAIASGNVVASVASGIGHFVISQSQRTSAG